jgi:hypothetical protein
VSTGNIADLALSFTDQPLRSLNNVYFQLLLVGALTQPSALLTLRGTADVVARTAIGNVPINGIPFSVPSSLTGKSLAFTTGYILNGALPAMNQFGGTAQLKDISVTGSGGGSQYIVAPLTTTLNNPSSISLSTVDLSLPAFYNSVQIGRAVINVS